MRQGPPAVTINCHMLRELNGQKVIYTPVQLRLTTGGLIGSRTLAAHGGPLLSRSLGRKSNTIYTSDSSLDSEMALPSVMANLTMAQTIRVGS